MCYSLCPKKNPGPNEQGQKQYPHSSCSLHEQGLPSGLLSEGGHQQRPVSPRGAVPPEAVPPEAVPPEAVPPEAVPPEAVPPEAVPPEAVPPEAVPPEAVSYICIKLQINLSQVNTTWRFPCTFLNLPLHATRHRHGGARQCRDTTATGCRTFDGHSGGHGGTAGTGFFVLDEERVDTKLTTTSSILGIRKKRPAISAL